MDIPAEANKQPPAQRVNGAQPYALARSREDEQRAARAPPEEHGRCSLLQPSYRSVLYHTKLRQATGARPRQLGRGPERSPLNTWRRRIRGAIGIGLAWGAAWFAAGMALLFVVGPDAADVPFPLFFGFLGFLAGAAFSAIVGIRARRRKFADLSLPRFAGWGALGGLALCGTVALIAGPGAELLVVGPVFALAGAISAAGTLAVARRAERHLLQAGTDAAELVGAGDDDARKVLGGRR